MSYQTTVCSFYVPAIKIKRRKELNNLRKIITRGEILALLIVIKDACEDVSSVVSVEELQYFILLLEKIDHDEILAIGNEVNDFYQTCFGLVYRLVKFNEISDLDFALNSIQQVLESNAYFISVTFIFENSESSIMFFIARLEEVLEDMCAHEKSHSNTADDMCWT